MQSTEIVRRRPGRPRSGLMFASASVSLESSTWKRIDALADARGLSRHAVLRLAVETAVDILEAQL